MLKNYFKSACRYLLKYKIPAAINISGLAIGIACFVLISMYIFDEISYDKVSPDADRTYRIATDFVNDAGFNEPEATSPPALSYSIQKNIPGVDEITKLFIVNDHKFYVRSGEKKFFENNIYHADGGFFDVFNIKVINGNAKEALLNPNGIVVSSSIAKKYFGSDDAIGKNIEIDDWGSKAVVAVMEDMPENMHFRVDILAPLLRFVEEDAKDNWEWFNFYTYVKLSPNTNVDALIKKVNSIYREKQPGSKSSFFSQKLTLIHLTSNLKYELSPNSDIIYVYILGTVAVLILLVAAINYVNLTTSFSFFRAKEIGLRKVTGASRKSLVVQFIFESVIVSVIATAIALLVVDLSLPLVNQISGKHLQLITLPNWKSIMYVLLIGIIIGFISGIFPAFYLSSLEPVRILKNKGWINHKGINLRKFFIITQFAISVVLIFGMIVVIRQVDFMQHKKLGLNKSNIIIVNDLFTLSKTQREALKNEWSNVKGVEYVASADGVLGDLSWSKEVRYKDSRDNQRINFLSVDADFIKALQIELKEGRNLSLNPAVDSVGEIVLNETGVKELGIPLPVVGQQVIWRTNADTKQNYYATIVGVVKDFHFASMKEQIKPFAFVANPKRTWNYTVKLNGADVYQSLTGMQQVWNKNVKEFPFKYSFLNDSFSAFYKSEANFELIFRYLTGVVIFISCIGLFGLSVLMIYQRNKEIGIRKVLGASVFAITTMLSKDFFKMTLTAAVIAFPLGWVAIQFWLQHFVYRVEVSIGEFFAAFLIAFVLVAFTISFQAIKAALANPVKSLRTE